MDEAQAIQLLIQATHKGQAAGSFQLMEAYTLAAAVDTATKLAERLTNEQNEKAKSDIIAEAAIEKAAPSANGEKKVGHEAPGAPELLKEIPIKSEKEDEKKK
jgi:hypothetical protein